MPAASVTVHVTVVEPTGKLDGASLEAVSPEQLSEVVGEPRATSVASHTPASAEVLTSAGQEMVGFSLSVTVTV